MKKERIFEPLTDEEAASLTPENGWLERWTKPNGLMVAVVNRTQNAIALLVDEHAVPEMEIISSPDLNIDEIRNSVLREGWSIEALTKGPTT